MKSSSRSVSRNARIPRRCQKRRGRRRSGAGRRDRNALCLALRTGSATVLQWKACFCRAGFKAACVAAYLGVTVRHLERLSARALGLSPRQFACNVRVQLAELLKAQGWSNKDVVAELGFADEPHLCAVFRRLRRRTPCAFKQVDRA